VVEKYGEGMSLREIGELTRSSLAQHTANNQTVRHRHDRVDSGMSVRSWLDLAIRIDIVTAASSPFDFVGLTTRFTSGWPWPEESYGLDPMFGPDGWCRSCGVPQHRQTGSLMIQGSKFPTGSVWMPNWHFDVVCLSGEVAHEVRSNFRVHLLPVRKPRGDTGVVQIVAPTTANRWYAEAELAERATRLHPEPGKRCAVCGVWRWLPIPDEELPPARVETSWSTLDVVASPESFGDGWSAFRDLLFRRSLAQALVAASPRVWSIVERPLVGQ
jgi:hypothetical protein